MKRRDPLDVRRKPAQEPGLRAVGVDEVGPHGADDRPDRTDSPRVARRGDTALKARHHLYGHAQAPQRLAQEALVPHRDAEIDVALQTPYKLQNVHLRAARLATGDDHEDPEGFGARSRGALAGHDSGRGSVVGGVA